DDRLVERLAVRAVILAEEDAQENGVLRERHDEAPPIWLSPIAATWPSQTARRQSTTESTMLAPAAADSPSRATARVWRLKEGEAVRPRQTRIMTNWRAAVPASSLPSGPVSVSKKPMTKEPETLTMMVPQGKVSPKRSAMRPEQA